jgi:uronate dehydrogenase
MAKAFHRLLLTGAAGGLGRVLREPLREWADVVRLSDRVDPGAAAAGEEVIVADLTDRAAIHALLRDVDAVVHFGGVSLESPFDDMVGPNVIGLNHLYEAAHDHGVKRVIYASSSHVMGFHRQTDVVGIDAPLRPDCLYAVTKCFGEALSRYYFDRFGLETVCLRIGSSFAEPKNPRMLVSLLTFRDLVELVRCALFAPRVDHSIIYGVSDNDVKWWDNTQASHLGFRPQDSSRPFKDRFAADPRAGSDDPATIYQGGPWVTAGPVRNRG